MKNKLKSLSVAAAFTAAMAVGASGVANADRPAVEPVKSDHTTAQTVNKKPVLLASSGGTVHGV